MKNVTITKTLLAVAAFIVLLAGAAPAQTLSASVPFAFVANGSVMPAGQYQLQMDWMHGMLTITQPGGHVVFVSAQTSFNGISNTDGALVFHRYGDRYFLKRVKAPAASEGMETIPSKAEKEAVRSGKPLEVAMIRILAQ